MKTESNFNPESKNNFEGEWYYDDDQVGELYTLMGENKISTETLRELLHQVNAQYQNLDSRTDKTDQEKINLGILDNIGRELTLKVGFKHEMDNPIPDQPQDLGNMVH